MHVTEPGNAGEATGGCSMKRGPALVIAAINICSIVDQKLHHIEIVVDACLKIKLLNYILLYVGHA